MNIPRQFYERKTERKINPTYFRNAKERHFTTVVFPAQYTARLLSEPGLLGVKLMWYKITQMNGERVMLPFDLKEYKVAVQQAFEQLENMMGAPKKVALCTTEREDCKFFMYHDTSDTDLSVALMLFESNPIENLRIEIFRVPCLGEQ
jgi:hypothetical protein